MAKIRVFYEEHAETNSLVPIWLVICFGRGNIDWTKNQFYLPLETPFKRMMREDFGDDVMSFSVTLEDLKRDESRPYGFLVDIQSIKNRIHKLQEEHPFDPTDIDQFIIQMGDIEEIMQMDVRLFYDWRM